MGLTDGQKWASQASVTDWCETYSDIFKTSVTQTQLWNDLVSSEWCCKTKQTQHVFSSRVKYFAKKQGGGCFSVFGWLQQLHSLSRNCHRFCRAFVSPLDTSVWQFSIISSAIFGILSVLFLLRGFDMQLHFPAVFNITMIPPPPKKKSQSPSLSRHVMWLCSFVFFFFTPNTTSCHCETFCDIFQFQVFPFLLWIFLGAIWRFMETKLLPQVTVKYQPWHHMDGPGWCPAPLEYVTAVLEVKIEEKDDKFSLTNLCLGKKCLKFNYPKKSIHKQIFQSHFFFFVMCACVISEYCCASFCLPSLATDNRREPHFHENLFCSMDYHHQLFPELFWLFLLAETYCNKSCTNTFWQSRPSETTGL